MSVLDEKPELVWVPRGYYSTSKIKEDDVQMLLIEGEDNWLEKLKSQITQINECLGEFDGHEWCDGHCLISGKCAQITLYVIELEQKAEKWTNFYDKMRPTLEKAEKYDDIQKMLKLIQGLRYGKNTQRAVEVMDELRKLESVRAAFPVLKSYINIKDKTGIVSSIKVIEEALESEG